MFKYLKRIIKEIYFIYLHRIKKLSPSIGESASFISLTPDSIKKKLNKEIRPFNEYLFDSLKIRIHPWPLRKISCF